MRSHLSVFVIALCCVSTLQISWSRSAAAEEGTIAIAELQRETPVDFEKEVLPILRRKCLACHNNTDAESDLVLETPQTIQKGGAQGPAVAAGKSGESLLLMVASHQEEPVMPPEDNEVGAKPLTPEELGLIKLWIDQGATGDVAGAADLNWQPLPPGVNPIYAVAVSPDGQYVAAGRANQIFVYHVPSKREVGRLTDPALLKTDIYNRPGVAHLDLVQSLRFGPDSRTLASGGYRTVKLWRRPDNDRKLSIVELESPPTAVAVSPDGRAVAVGHENGSLLLLAGSVVQRLAAHKGAVTGLQFAAEGARLVSASLDQTLRVWNTQTGESLAAVATPAAVNALALVNKQSQIATAGADNLIRIWALPAETADEPSESPQPLKELSGHSGPVTSLAAIGADGAQLLSGSQDGTLRVWDVNGGNQVRQMSHGGPIESVAARPDGSRFASAGANDAAKLWDANGKQLAELKGDVRRQLRVEDVERALAIAKRQIDNTKADLKQATDRKAAEEKNANTVEEARKKAEDEFKQKEEAATKAIAEKKAAEESVATAKEEVAKNEAAQKAAETAVAQSTERIEKAGAEAQSAEKAIQEAQKTLDDALAAKQKAESDKQKAEEEKKKAEEAKAKAENDKKQAEQQIADAEQEATEAEEAKKAAEAAIAQSTKLIEKAVADVQAAAKAVQESQKAMDDALAAKQKAESDKQKAEEEKKKAEEAKAKAENDKKQAEQQVATAQKNVQQAEEQLKKVTEPADKAAAERDAAKKTLESAERTASRAQETLKKVADQIPDIEATVKQAEEEAEQAEATLGTVKEEAAASDKPYRAVGFSPDGQSLATGGDNQTLCTWDAESGAAIETYTGHAEQVRGVAYTPHGDLVSIAADRSVYVWNARPEWTLARVIGAPDAPQLFVDRVTALDFSPDGKLLATGGGEPSRSGELKIFNVEDGTLVREIPEAHSDTIFGLEFSPDGKQIASCGADRFAKIFKAESGEFVRAFEGHTHHVLGVSWRADGRQLATAGADNVIKVWDVRTGDQQRTITGFNKEVTALRFVSTGDDVIASSGDKTVQQKNTGNGRNVRSFGGAADFMYSVMPSDNGKLIVAGGQDSVVRVWNDSGQVIINFDPPAPPQQSGAE